MVADVSPESRTRNSALRALVVVLAVHAILSVVAAIMLYDKLCELAHALIRKGD